MGYGWIKQLVHSWYLITNRSYLIQIDHLFTKLHHLHYTFTQHYFFRLTGDTTFLNIKFYTQIYHCKLKMPVTFLFGSQLKIKSFPQSLDCVTFTRMPIKIAAYLHVSIWCRFDPFLLTFKRFFIFCILCFRHLDSCSLVWVHLDDLWATRLRKCHHLPTWKKANS